MQSTLQSCPAVAAAIPVPKRRVEVAHRRQSCCFGAALAVLAMACGGAEASASSDAQTSQGGSSSATAEGGRGGSSATGTVEAGAGGVASSQTADTCDCTATEGCLAATVVVQATGQQPWVKGYPDADGIGSLIVAAYLGDTLVTRVAFGSADFTNLEASQTFPIGCLAAGAIRMQFFFDDNVNAATDAVTSVDAADTCGGGTQLVSPVVNVVAGGDAEVVLSLGPSCNTEFD